MKLLSEKKQISHGFRKNSKQTIESLSVFFREEILSARFFVPALVLVSAVVGLLFFFPKSNDFTSAGNKPEKEAVLQTQTKETPLLSQKDEENTPTEAPALTSPENKAEDAPLSEKENTPTVSTTVSSTQHPVTSTENASGNLHVTDGDTVLDQGSDNDPVKNEDLQIPDRNGVVYTYRAATAKDLDSTAALPADAITITGVKTPSKNFIYEIPEKINGKTVVAIGNGAFGDYTFLKEHFPDYKNNQDAYRIREITFPEGLLAIGDSAFLGSLYLEEMTLPKSLVYIGGGAFQNCYFETVKIQGTSRIEVYSFENCRIGSLSLEEGVETIAYCAFRNASIIQINFPKSMKMIVNSAFHNANIFQSTLLIPSSTTIESSAFYGCSVTIRRV